MVTVLSGAHPSSFALPLPLRKVSECFSPNENQRFEEKVYAFEVDS